MTAAYLDASAVVKLFKAEPETPSLERQLEDHPAWISSELVVVEARCTARRVGGMAFLAKAEEALARVDLIALTQPIRDRAGEPFQRHLRALDAIHGASILALGDRIDAVFAYDSDLKTALQAEGVTVAAPGAP